MKMSLQRDDYLFVAVDVVREMKVADDFMVYGQ